jgi:hypothetical protein
MGCSSISRRREKRGWRDCIVFFHPNPALSSGVKGEVEFF